MILLYTDAEAYAGTEAHILTLARAVRAEGMEAVIACPAESPLARQCRSAALPVLAVEKKGLIDFPAIAILQRELRAGRLIHAHNGRTALNAALAVTLARRGQFIYTQHFLAPARTERKRLAAISSRLGHRWMNRQCSGAIAISEAVRAAMIGRGDLPPEKIRVVPNGISDPLNSETDVGREQARRELGLEADAFIIFSAARLEKEKSLDVLVRAIGLASGTFKRIQCLIAGEGQLRAALEEQIRAGGLTDRIKLLGKRDDVPTILRAADVFVLPSAAEPFGLAIVEAMAMERAVIASDAGGPREIVEQGVTGMLVSPADPEALAAAIVDLARKPEKIDAMGLAGRERYLRLFTADRMAQETARFYSEVGGG